MSDVNERYVELAEAAVANQSARAIGDIRNRLSAQGSDDCVDCGDEIEPKRRAALPSAVRCVDCQGIFEQRGRRAA